LRSAIAKPIGRLREPHARHRPERPPQAAPTAARPRGHDADCVAAGEGAQRRRAGSGRKAGRELPRGPSPRLQGGRAVRPRRNRTTEWVSTASAASVGEPASTTIHAQRSTGPSSSHHRPVSSIARQRGHEHAREEQLGSRRRAAPPLTCGSVQPSPVRADRTPPTPLQKRLSLHSGRHAPPPVLLRGRGDAGGRPCRTITHRRPHRRG